MAREAGAQLLEAFAGPAIEVESKSTPTDLVSAADKAAEELIIGRISAARPGDGFLGEEGADEAGSSGLRWVVDPLDGTANFLFGLPQWAVSIAVEDERRGARRRRLRPAARRAVGGRRAAATRRSTARRCAARAASELATALVATGFGYDAEVRRAQAATIAALLPEVRDVRRFGAAALDLAWCAAGRFDAYYERGVKRWDIAAGGLLCERAGLVVEPLAPAPPQERRAARRRARDHGRAAQRVA